MSVDIIVCNLTRLGDLLQSQPLIDDLTSAGHKVGLVCLENFHSAAKMLRNVSRIWPLSGASLMAALDRSWPLAVEMLLNFTEQILGESKPGVVINLTPTLSARILARLLAGKTAIIHGFAIDEYGYGINNGIWSSFLSVAARKRINAPFNIADMLRSISLPGAPKFCGSHMLAMPEPAAMAWAKDFIGKANAKAAGFVAFQLGASETKRRWPVNNFCALGDRLWRETGLMPVLLGSDAEAPLGEEYSGMAEHPFINAMGKTDLMQLAALLRQCKLLVTNDTGTMHLAAGQGTPVLAFFLATAQPWDTGPLLSGCCCLEPAMACHPCAFNQTCPTGNSCRSFIESGAAGDLALGWIKTGSWQSGITDNVRTQCRVWLTAHDEEGFATVECISGHDQENRNLWMRWLRIFWRQLLDCIEKHIPSPQSQPKAYARLQLPPDAAKTAETLIQANKILESISACGSLTSKNKRGAQLFLRNCERLQSCLEAWPPLDTLAAFWHEFRQNQGDDLDTFLPAIHLLREHINFLANALSGPQSA